MRFAPLTRRGFYTSMVAAQAGMLVVAGRLAESYVSIDCPIRSLTGLQCPGCGSTRCLSAIAGGDLIESFQHNPLVSMLLTTSTVVGAVGVASPSLVKSLFGMYQRHQASVARVSVVAVAFFTIGRNMTL